MKPFKDILKGERVSRGWSQADLDKHADLPRGTTNHFETGYRKPSMGNFRKLCVALNVSAGKLLGIE